jgi:hypothetical protein
VILIAEAGACAGAAAPHNERLSPHIEDLRRIAGGDLPREADVRDAPLLDYGAVAVRPVPGLVGRLIGDPTVIGPTIRICGVWAIAPGLGWARTLTRTYALGRPHPTRLSVRPDAEIWH